MHGQTHDALVGDTLAGLNMVTEGEELMIVTNRSIIIRQLTSAISIQSRPASGVRLQRLDAENEIVAIAIVPLADGEEGGLEGLEGDDGLDADVVIDVEAIAADVDPEADVDA